MPTKTATSQLPDTTGLEPGEVDLLEMLILDDEDTLRRLRSHTGDVGRQITEARDRVAWVRDYCEQLEGMPDDAELDRQEQRADKSVQAAEAGVRRAQLELQNAKADRQAVDSARYQRGQAIKGIGRFRGTMLPKLVRLATRNARERVKMLDAED